MKYDYLVVGSGLYGAIFAHEAKRKGKKVLVIDKRPNIAGNIFTEDIEGIHVHKYGAHIFHTNNKKVWNYITQFAEFNRFTNSPVANYKGELYSLPFNMYTFNKMWGVVTPEEAEAKIEKQKKEAGIKEPANLEEQAISLVGTDIYEKLIKGYTEKLVFSFADIAEYKKVKRNLETNNIHYEEFNESTMYEIASGLAELNKKWGYELATCSEKIPLEQFGIQHNRCIDDTLIAKIAYNDSALMKFLGYEVVSHFGKEFGAIIPDGALEITDTMYLCKKKDNKDKGQRQFCGCIVSKDIGQYNTCPHLCEYCYANSSKATAVRNWNKHKLDPFNENILGKGIE